MATTYSATVATSSAAGDTLGAATPRAALDGRLRLLWGADSFGRGASVTIRPNDAFAQWVCHSVRVTAIPSQASPDDY